MLVIYQAENHDDFSEVRGLLLEYLTWATSQAKEHYNVEVDVDDMLHQSIAELDLFTPPSGRLLLVKEDEAIAGIACMKKLRDDTCEIKRMYVRPSFRGKQIGRSLLNALIQDAKEIGYSKILLDSARFMEAAHKLYRSTGFKEIELYPETEMTEDFQEYMVYMEMIL